MKLISQYGLRSIATLSVVLALLAPAHSDELSASKWKAIDESPIQMPSTPVADKKPGNKEKACTEVATSAWIAADPDKKLNANEKAAKSDAGPSLAKKPDVRRRAATSKASALLVQVPGKAPDTGEETGKSDASASRADEQAGPAQRDSASDTGRAGSDTNRDESATSAATSSTPNMIGDTSAGKTLGSKLPLPSHLGPVQSGSFNLPPTGIVPVFVANSVVLATSATTLYGSHVPSTSFTIANPGNPGNPSAIPLTNTDSAYLNAAQQALKNHYSSLNTANQQLSSVTVSGTGATASETVPHKGPIQVTPSTQRGDTFNVTQFYQYQYSIIPSFININIPTPSGSFIGRQRISDDENPVPMDRVFCDFSYFHDAAMATPSDVNRFVPGFEKTFFQGRMSVEMRFPMSVMESSNITADSSSFGSTGQFGDMEVILKAIVLERETWTLCMGLGVSVPTGPDVNVGLADGTPLVKIANRSTHLLPFFGLLVQPNDDWFAQAYLQIDVAASGDPVSANAAGTGLVPAGDINDQTQLFADALIGRYLYRNPCRRLSSVSAVLEAHYTGGLNAPSAVQAGNFTIGDNSASYNVLDLTLGAHAVVGCTTFTAGYSVPVTEDRGFEGEFRFFINRRF